MRPRINYSKEAARWLKKIRWNNGIWLHDSNRCKCNRQRWWLFFIDWGRLNVGEMSCVVALMCLFYVVESVYNIIMVRLSWANDKLTILIRGVFIYGHLLKLSFSNLFLMICIMYWSHNTNQKRNMCILEVEQKKKRLYLRNWGTRLLNYQ